VVVYDKIKVKREDVDTYEELADPKNKGRICIRSGSHPYNLSLFGAVTEHLGEPRPRNGSRASSGQHGARPQGRRHRPDQGRGRGECQVAVSNTYYIARLMRSTNPEDRALMER
jgi:iron(III) transport system substrate-binding protein